MSIWKINGTDLAALGLAAENLTLIFESQRPDVLTIRDPLAAFDDAPRWAFDAELVLTRNDGAHDLTVFRGRLRRSPAFLGTRAERIDYVAHGPWDWLERICFRQSFQYANDPSNPSSTLHS